MDRHSLAAYVAFLRSWGLKVVVVHKPARPGSWGVPRALFVHHTGDTCDPGDVEAVLRVVRDGRPDVTGPLAQELVGQDGVVYVIAAPQAGQAAPGRCNHAGKGVCPRLRLPRDNGGQYSSGTEVQCSGEHPLSTHPQVYRVAIRLQAAKCAWYGLDAAAVIGHKEYTTRKIDPRDDMDRIRRDVAAELEAGPSRAPAATPQQEDDMPLTPQDVQLILKTKVPSGIVRGQSGQTVEWLLATAAAAAHDARRTAAAALARVAALEAAVAAAGTGITDSAVIEAASTRAAEKALAGLGADLIDQG